MIRWKKRAADTRLTTSFRRKLGSRTGLATIMAVLGCCSSGLAFAEGIWINAFNMFIESSPKPLGERLLAALDDPKASAGIAGCSIIIPWSVVDSGDGEYDWKTVESWISSCIAPEGKPSRRKVNLIVWGAEQNLRQTRWIHKAVCRTFRASSTCDVDEARIKNAATPIHVLSVLRGAGQTVLCSEMNSVEVPVFWHEGYRKPYREFIKAVLERYDGDSRIGYMRFGIGVGGEDYISNGLFDPDNRSAGDHKKTCLQAWQSKGIDPEEPDKWISHTLGQLEFISGFSPKSFQMVTLNGYGQKNADLRVAKSVASFVVANNATWGMGTQGLAVNAIKLHEKNEPCYANWCEIFERHRSNVVLEVQTTSQSDPRGVSKPGSLVELLPFSRRLGASDFELYARDILGALGGKYAPPGFSREQQCAYAKAFAETNASLGLPEFDIRGCP